MFISLLILIIIHIEATGIVAHYEESKNSIQMLRESNPSDKEVIVISQKVLEINTMIAEKKAYNDGIFDIFVPDKLAELEYIQ